MTLPEALIARLDAGATAALATGGIGFTVRDQGSGFPAVVLQAISEQRPRHLDGFEDMRTARIQASCIDEDYLSARTTTEAVIADLSGEAEVDDIKFWAAGVEGPRDFLDTTGETPAHVIITDFIIRYAEVEA